MIGIFSITYAHSAFNRRFDRMNVQPITSECDIEMTRRASAHLIQGKWKKKWGQVEIHEWPFILWLNLVINVCNIYTLLFNIKKKTLFDKIHRYYVLKHASESQWKLSSFYLVFENHWLNPGICGAIYARKWLQAYTNTIHSINCLPFALFMHNFSWKSYALVKPLGFNLA